MSNCYWYRGSKSMGVLFTPLYDVYSPAFSRFQHIKRSTLFQSQKHQSVSNEYWHGRNKASAISKHRLHLQLMRLL